MISDKQADIIDRQTHAPFMTVDDMVTIHKFGRSPLRRQLDKMERAGLVCRVPHALEGRNASQRYAPTGKGVIALADKRGVPIEDIMRRPGGTGRGLAVFQRRLDILATVYKVAGAVARCYDEPAVRLRLTGGRPLDAVIMLPDRPYSVGLMVNRPCISYRSWEWRLRVYADEETERPSVLLVVSPDPLSDHDVARRVARNCGELALTASLEEVADPFEEVWRQPKSYNERARSLPSALDRVPQKVVTAYEPEVQDYKRAALPPTVRDTTTVLTQAERRTLYVIADWLLAKESLIVAVSGLRPDTVKAMLKRLVQRGLVRWVAGCDEFCPDAESDQPRLALTDAGIRLICYAACARYGPIRHRWSSEENATAQFAGTRLRKLAKEHRHTDMVYDPVERFANSVSEDMHVQSWRVTPAHLAEQHFQLEDNSSEAYHHILPDAAIHMETTRGAFVLLLEAERGWVWRGGMEKRLKNYQRYFRTRRSKLDYPVRPLIACVLEDPGREANFHTAQVDAGLDCLPTIITNLEQMAAYGGPLAAVWGRPGRYGERKWIDEMQEQKGDQYE